MALGVDIISAFDGTGIKKAVEEFKKLETTGQKAQFAIQKAAIPAAAALAGVAAGLGLAVKGAIADQQAAQGLAMTLKNVTGATQEQIEANEAFLRSQEMTTMFNNGEMRPALESLVRATGDLGTAQNSLKLAMDISAATGQDLTTVSQALAKAHSGQVSALQKLSPMLRDNIKEGASLDQVFLELTKTFGGATAAASETAAGQFAILQNQLNSLKDDIGKALLPIVEAIIPVFRSMAEFAGRNTTVFVVLAGVIAAFSTAIIAASTAVKIHTTYQKLMKIELLANSAAFKNAGAMAIGFGTALGGLLIAQTLAPLINNLTGATGRAADAFKKTGSAINDFNNNTGTAQEVLTQFINSAQEELRKFDPVQYIKDISTFSDFGREFELVAGDIKLDIEVVDRTFKQFADSSPAYAQSIINAMKAQLAITDPTTRAYADLKEAVARYEAQLRIATGAQNAFNGAVSNTPTVVAFTGAMARLESQTVRENKARLASAGAIEEWNKKVEAARNKAKGAADTVKTFAEKLGEYTAALKGNYDAQRSLTSATNGRIAAEKALGTATENTRKAQEYFNKVVGGFPKTSKQAIAATKDYENAQRRLRDSQLSQRDAILEVKKAEEALQKLRDIKADPESVAEAERGLERSKYAVEEANFSVIEAEKDLAELRLNPEANPIEIRRAEINLAQAKLAVSDAVHGVKEAEKALADEINRKATAEEIAEAEHSLQKAKEGVEKATEAVRDATYEEGVAQAFLNQVLHGATKESEAYEEALRELNDAKDEEEQARIRVADAILGEAEATLALAAAIKELNKVTAASPPKVVSRGQAQLEGISTSNPALSALNQVNQPQTTGAPINVTVNAGLGSDPDSITRGLMDMFKQYERANGFLPLNVASAVAFG